jgi:hypothetical protein
VILTNVAAIHDLGEVDVLKVALLPNDVVVVVVVVVDDDDDGVTLRNRLLLFQLLISPPDSCQARNN